MTATDPRTVGVPTELYIAGRWRPSTDGARFPVSRPGHRRDARQRGQRRGERRPGRCGRRARGWWCLGRDAAAPRSEILRRAFELMTARAEDLAELIVAENGKAMPTRGARSIYAAEFFRWYAEEAVRLDRHVSDARPRGAQPDPGAAPAGRRERAHHAVELPGRHGHPQDRPGAGGRLHRHAQARAARPR